MRGNLQFVIACNDGKSLKEDFIEKSTSTLVLLALPIIRFDLNRKSNEEFQTILINLTHKRNATTQQKEITKLWEGRSELRFLIKVDIL